MFLFFKDEQTQESGIDWGDSDEAIALDEEDDNTLLEVGFDKK